MIVPFSAPAPPAGGRRRGANLRRTYWLQAPGAAPRSTTSWPGCEQAAAPRRSPSACRRRGRGSPRCCASFTYGSLRWSCSHALLTFLLLPSCIFIARADNTGDDRPLTHARRTQGTSAPKRIISTRSSRSAPTALTAGRAKEIDAALSAHGLIKVRVFSDDRAAREALLAELADALGAAPIQHIGKLLVLWRPLPPKDEGRARGPHARARRSSRCSSSRRAATTARRSRRSRCSATCGRRRRLAQAREEARHAASRSRPSELTAPPGRRAGATPAPSTSSDFSDEERRR